MSSQYDSETKQAPRGGLFLLQGLILLLFCVLSVRLWYLQIHRGQVYADAARDNQTRQASISSPRGMIWDRTGRTLALNEPSFALGLVREDVENLGETVKKVAELTGTDVGHLWDVYNRGRKRVKPFEPLILVNELSFEQLARIESNAVLYPGLEIIVRHKRTYPKSELVSHVLGYVAEANEEELQNDSTLALGDSVGKNGIELVLENRLRGQKGLKTIEVDALGRELSEEIQREPKAGGNLTLSIDLALQEKTVAAMGEHNGAVVVMEPESGKIVAYVSKPAYDNNLFVLGLSPRKWKELQTDPGHPLQNRVAQSVYPPGSVFKILMAACGLSEGLLHYTDTASCSGVYKLGNRDFHCWKKEGHGTVNLKQALVSSCDVYFWQLGERLGIDRINRFALACGFGAPTGIDLPHEKSGLIPSTAWKKRRYGEAWTRGETLNASIGQGYVQVTPLQVARFLSALVNGGKLMKPTLVATDQPTVVGKIPLSDKDREYILEAMVATVDSGTARSIKRPDARMGGKTGTAQVVKLNDPNKRAKTNEMAYKYRDHAWIATFGQKDGKSYVVVCMGEHAGHGGEVAGPIVRSVYNHLFGTYSGPAVVVAKPAGQLGTPGSRED